MRFRPNPAFMREVEASSEFRRARDDVAREVATSVRNVSRRTTGYYSRSIRAQDGMVISTDPFAHLVEWGSANNPPYAPLRRGVLAAGLRFQEQPKT